MQLRVGVITGSTGFGMQLHAGLEQNQYQKSLLDANAPLHDQYWLWYPATRRRVADCTGLCSGPCIVYVFPVPARYRHVISTISARYQHVIGMGDTGVGRGAC
eukprot:3940856-Rhodomonas_salina.3